MSETDLKVSRAIELASEICATLEWRSDRCQATQLERDTPEQRAGYAAFMLGDSVAVFCGYLETLGLSVDAASIAESARRFRHAVWQNALTEASANWSREMICWAQEEYGAFPSPPKTEGEIETHELRGIAIVGLAELLRKRVLEVKTSLADAAASRPSEASGASGDAQPVATGFLGGAALADALGIVPERRDAFFRQLERQRKNLGDEAWHEVREPRPNGPRFLYQVNSGKVRDLAVEYQKRKPT